MDLLKAKYGLIKEASFVKESYHSQIRDSFFDVVADGEQYKAIFCFDSYLNQGQFDHVFGTKDEFDDFLAATKWHIKDTNFNWEVDEITVILMDGRTFTGECTNEWGIQRVYEFLNENANQ